MTPEKYIIALCHIKNSIEADPNCLINNWDLVELCNEVKKYEECLYPLVRLLPDILAI